MDSALAEMRLDSLADQAKAVCHKSKLNVPRSRSPSKDKGSEENQDLSFPHRSRRGCSDDLDRRMISPRRSSSETRANRLGHVMGSSLAEAKEAVRDLLKKKDKGIKESVGSLQLEDQTDFARSKSSSAVVQIFHNTSGTTLDSARTSTRSSS